MKLLVRVQGIKAHKLIRNELISQLLYATILYYLKYLDKSISFQRRRKNRNLFPWLIRMPWKNITMNMTTQSISHKYIYVSVIVYISIGKT